MDCQRSRPSLRSGRALRLRCTGCIDLWVGGGLLRGEMGFDFLDDLARGAPRRAFEGHVFQQMRDAVLVRLLVAAADPVLLRQVVIGLLTNAYKHTSPPGTVYT